MSDCLFCKIISGDIPSYKVYEDDLVLAFLDIHPVNPGHTLVIPKEHASDIHENSIDVARALMDVAHKISPLIAKAVGAPAHNLTFNCGAASGQAVFHTHLHIIPRFEDDGHRMWQGRKDAGDLLGISEAIKRQF